MKTYTFRMSEARAFELGLLICECGHRNNNHFDWSACAYCGCKKHKIVPVYGVTLVRRKRKTS